MNHTDIEDENHAPARTPSRRLPITFWDPLTCANLLFRPARTLATVCGIGLGVCLILVTSGLANGMIRDASDRQSALGAELLFQPPGSFSTGLTASPLALPVAYSAALSEIDGVRATTPVGRFVQSGAQGLGFELIEGITTVASDEGVAYSDITEMELSDGRLALSGYEAIIDAERAKHSDATLGSRIEILGHAFTVVGIFDPPVGARVKIPLATMQTLLGNDDKCSWILIQVDHPLDPNEAARRINARFPGNQIIFTRDIPTFLRQGIPSLRVFLRVVLLLSAIISALMSLVTMYTAVLERRREIGLLKAIGAATSFTVGTTLKEAMLLAVGGVCIGSLGAVVVRLFVQELTTLHLAFEPRWSLIAISTAFLATLVGSLYPALQAARLDPVEALNYE